MSKLVVPEGVPPKAIGEFFAAIARAQASLEPLSKGSRNTYDKYDYTSMDQFSEECGGALNAEGLALVNVRNELRQDMKVLHGQYFLVHTSGCYLVIETDVPVVPNPKRPNALDKAVAAAMTYSQGFTVRNVTCAARSDGEPDQRADTPSARGQPKAKAPIHEGRTSTLAEAQRKRSALKRLSAARDILGESTCRDVLENMDLRSATVDRLEWAAARLEDFITQNASREAGENA